MLPPLVGVGETVGVGVAVGLDDGEGDGFVLLPPILLNKSAMPTFICAKSPVATVIIVPPNSSKPISKPAPKMSNP
jgi:hypothetical protein